jgi:cell division septation protein DedD
MRARRRRKLSPLQRVLLFWLVTLLVSGTAALASFRVGRDWLGKRLADVKMAPGAPRIVAETQGDSAETARAAAEAKAPDKAVVRLEDREPGANESREIKDRGAPSLPVGGAEVHEPEGKTSDAETRASSLPPLPPPPDEQTAEDASGRYAVTAGAFEGEEQAGRTVAMLAARGYKPRIQTIKREGRTLRQVNVAVVRGRARAEDLRDQLTADGIPADIARAR